MQIQNITYRFSALGASLVLTGLLVLAPHVRPTVSQQRLLTAIDAEPVGEGSLPAAAVAALLRNS